MLNITIYQNVPLQKNYQNVVYLSQNDFDTFLSNYYVGNINNVKSYFDGGDNIQLPIMYENCNYMRIEDTNSTQQIKYYFIDSTKFISGNAIKYNIILDVWHTYRYNITHFYNSLFVRGHADAFNKDNGILKINSIKTPKLLNRNDANLTHLTNYLIEPLNIETNTTRRVEFLAIVSTSDGTKLLLLQPSQMALINYSYCLSNLYKNKYYYNNGTNIIEMTFETLKLYCISDINFHTLYGSQKGYHIYANNTATSDTYTDMYCYDLKTFDGVIQGATPFMLKLNLLSKTIYNTSKTNVIANRKLRAKRRILVGAINNNKEINTSVDFGDNETMYLNMYIQETNALQIMFEYGNNKIDITSNFELPVVNDSYTLYMNLNQKQIENANITNSLTYLLSSISIGAGVLLAPVTAGASLGLAGLGFAGATANYIGKETGLNAKIQDAKNNTDRLDNTNTNIGLTYEYGIGAFEFEFNDEYLEDTYNRFGCETQFYVSQYYAFNQPKYNFAFVQFQDVNFDGNFNENIKMILKTIFENGVRIWYDTTHFLENVDYRTD